ncbi:MAG: HEAT repeat domain-containing protein, partial [Acidobacteria bacterium]|nr:HEAT repeat domain-containing protein [Acidobacteriota bacterium]
KKAATPEGKEKTVSEGTLSLGHLEAPTLYYHLLKNPKELVPLVLRLFGDRNRLVHEGAVVTLAEWLGDSRTTSGMNELPVIKDVARALTPWLTNPSWADKEARQSYLQGLAPLQLPEALDGLLWILENEADEDLLMRAAECLLAYRNPIAAPALRRALERTTDEAPREGFITALYECGGFTDDEIAAALEAFARKMIAPTGADDVANARYNLNGKAETLPMPISIGRVVHESQTLAATEGMTLKLFERIRQLRRTNLPLAKQLLEIIQNVPLPIADQFFAERIAEGWVDADGVMLALERRDTMKKHAGDALVKLAYGNGAAAGVAVALLDNEERARDLLKGSDVLAQKALLACMRYMRDSLSVDLVAPLLKNAALEKFAERYLMVEDSRAARELVWARHPREAMILGASFEELVFHDTAEYVYDRLADREKVLQVELKAPNAPHAIYAVVAGNEDSQPGTIEVRVWRDRADLRVYLDPAHWRKRQLSANEFAALQTLTARSEIEDLGPASWELDARRGFYEYVRISAEGGRRICLAGLHPTPAHEATLHETLAGFFLQLSRTGDFKIGFALEKFFPALTVLPPDELYRPLALCGEPGRLQVLTEENSERQKQLLARRLQNYPEWRDLTAQGIGGKSSNSPRCRTPWLEFLQEQLSQGRQTERAVLETIDANFANLFVLRGIAPDYPRFSFTAALLKELGDDYVYGVLSPDKHWLVAVRHVTRKMLPQQNDTQDERPFDYQLVRYQVATKRVYPLGNPSEDVSFPMIWLSAHGKMLMGDHFYQGVEGSNPIALLDPATGLTQPIKGEFRPLFNVEEIRELQPAGKPHEFWAAIYERDKNLTRIGRYDTYAFKFTQLLELPDMKVESSSIWMDEIKRELWMVYEGNLVRIPIATKTK